MPKLKVVLDPEQREEHINKLLAQDGLAHIKEDPQAAYCPLSLTSTPSELKPIIQLRQDTLKNQVLKTAGIKAYDPATAPFSPDTNLTSQPDEVYLVDSGKIVGARFFVGHNLLPSTGFGIEAEKAKTFNRIAVIMMDNAIRISRMQPHRAIYLQYDNFIAQHHEFTSVFEMLQEFDPGMGFADNKPVLLGFEKTTSQIVDLEAKTYSEFPHLQYHYDGTLPIVKLRTENPEVFNGSTP